MGAKQIKKLCWPI